jgi:hypothetical protein
MALVDLTKPSEKKKLIFAAVLGLGAILVLYWALIGFDSRPPQTNRTTASATPQRPARTTQRPTANAPVSPEIQNLAAFAPISGSEAKHLLLLRAAGAASKSSVYTNSDADTAATRSARVGFAVERLRAHRRFQTRSCG